MVTAVLGRGLSRFRPVLDFVAASALGYNIARVLLNEFSMAQFTQAKPGGVVEWLMAPVLKTGRAQALVGSNPTPSAILTR